MIVGDRWFEYREGGVSLAYAKYYYKPDPSYRKLSIQFFFTTKRKLHLGGLFYILELFL